MPCAVPRAPPRRRLVLRTEPSAACAAWSTTRRSRATRCADRRIPPPPTFRANAPRKPPARPAKADGNRVRRPTIFAAQPRRRSPTRRISCRSPGRTVPRLFHSSPPMLLSSAQHKLPGDRRPEPRPRPQPCHAQVRRAIADRPMAHCGCAKLKHRGAGDFAARSALGRPIRAGSGSAGGAPRLPQQPRARSEGGTAFRRKLNSSLQRRQPTCPSCSAGWRKWRLKPPAHAAG